MIGGKEPTDIGLLLVAFESKGRFLIDHGSSETGFMGCCLPLFI